MTLSPPGDIEQLLTLISLAYDHAIIEHGPGAVGVCWTEPDDQVRRYELLLQGVRPEDRNGSVSINDLGCGYGALFDLVADRPLMQGGRYFGYDLSAAMIRTATERHRDPRAMFVESPVALFTSDYSFVSGTFNFNFGARPDLWRAYIEASLKDLWSKTGKVMAFNLLDNRCQNQLDDLYYADRAHWIAFAKTLSPEVEMRDDVVKDDFTLFVARTP